MPEISRFLGIVIAIFYRDHEPSHFHAYYGEYEITVGIRDGVVSGAFLDVHCDTYSNGASFMRRLCSKIGNSRVSIGP